MEFLKKNQKRKIYLTLFTFFLIFTFLSVKSYAGKSKGKGYLGVNIEKLSGDDREEFGVKFGVLVTKVIEGEAAAKYGIKKYDVIQYIGDTKTRRPDDVTEVLGNTEPNTRIKIQLVRDGKKQSVSVVLGKSDRKGFSFYFDNNKLRGKLKMLKEFKMGEIGYLGVEMRSMDDDFAKYFGVKKDGGALVTSVIKDSAAKKAGMISGDVILKIDEKTVKCPEDVFEIIREKNKGDKIRIKFLRHKKIKNITVRLGARSSFGTMFFGDDTGSVIDLRRSLGINESVPEIEIETIMKGNGERKMMIEKMKKARELEMIEQSVMQKDAKMKKMQELRIKKLKDKLKRIKEGKKGEVFL